MEAVKRVIELNEAAVLGLHEGSLDTSVNLLREALTIYRLQVVGGDGITEVQSPDQANRKDQLLAVEVHDSLCDSDASVTPDNLYSAYNFSFCFMHDVVHTDSAAVVVLFNYGLSLHRRGMITGHEIDLRKALQLYSMAYALLQDESLSSRFELGRLGLALLANQTQLYQHFIDHRRVESCLYHIRHLLECRQQMKLTSEEFGFFFHFVFFSTDQLAASPAA
jgi:hypothetical protein